MAAAFIAAALVGAQLAENFLNTQYNWVVGSLTAGLLAFAVKPLQSIAERVADRALPSTKGASRLTDPERIVAYQRNVEIAWADGTIGKKERQLLRNMREYLGVSAEEAEAAELRVTSLT